MARASSTGKDVGVGTREEEGHGMDHHCRRTTPATGGCILDNCERELNDLNELLR
jgi:hypothetical protein